MLVEKSFTRNAAEAQLIADAARANGVFAMEAMWTRFVPTMVKLREWIASGVLGEITAVMSDHSQSLSTSAEGRHHNPELGGGALLDLGVYNASFAHDLLGAPTEILGRGRLTSTGVDAEVSMLFVHEGGAQSTHHTSMVNPGPNNAAVIGTLGCVEVDATFYNWTSMTRFDTSRTREPVGRFDPVIFLREVKELAAAGGALRAGPHLARHALPGPRGRALRAGGAGGEPPAHPGRLRGRDGDPGRASPPARGGLPGRVTGRAGHRPEVYSLPAVVLPSRVSRFTSV